MIAHGQDYGPMVLFFAVVAVAGAAVLGGLIYGTVRLVKWLRRRFG